MKEPSIHITLSAFIELMSRRITTNSFNPGDIKDIKQFFKEAKQYSLSSRSVIQGNNRKTRRKVEQIQQSSIGDANLLADIIYAVRIKLKHTGVTKITQSSSQWRMLKELVSKVNAFCNDFNLNKREGYIVFVEKGMILFKNTKKRSMIAPVNYLNQNYEAIVEEYNSEYSLSHDEDVTGTQEIYDIYTGMVLEMTGIPNSYKNDPKQYINFKYAREEADKVGVDYSTYIEAQFDALSFCNGIPRPEDLSGTKAQERLTRYISKTGIPVRSKSQPSSKIDWSQFKK